MTLKFCKCNCAAQLEALADQMQRRCLEHDLQIAALLEHFERQQKQPLEFVEVPAQPARIQVQRRKG